MQKKSRTTKARTKAKPQQALSWQQQQDLVDAQVARCRQEMRPCVLKIVNDNHPHAFEDLVQASMQTCEKLKLVNRAIPTEFLHVEEKMEQGVRAYLRTKDENRPWLPFCLNIGGGRYQLTNSAPQPAWEGLYRKRERFVGRNQQMFNRLREDYRAKWGTLPATNGVNGATTMAAPAPKATVIKKQKTTTKRKQAA